MADDREKLSDRLDEWPRDTTNSAIGSGFLNQARGPGMELPEPPSDEEVERIARKLGAPTAQRHTLPLEGD